MMRPPVVLLNAVALLCAVASTSEAQGQSHWGVGGSLVPRWTFMEPLADLMDVDTDIRGADMRLGVVRGRDLDGDWGVMFVRKTIDDGSVWQLGETACVQTAETSSVCARGTYYVTRGARLTGVEAYRFFPFGTIARRVQPGVTIAGGIGRLEGDTDRFVEHVQVTRTLVPLRTTIGVETEPLGPGLFRDTIKNFDVVPIGRVEVGLAVLVVPGLKLRASGGVNFPGFHSFGFHAHYLFGAR